MRVDVVIAAIAVFPFTDHVGKLAQFMQID